MVSFGGTVQRHTTSPDDNHGTLSHQRTTDIQYRQQSWSRSTSAGLSYFFHCYVRAVSPRASLTLGLVLTSIPREINDPRRYVYSKTAHNNSNRFLILSTRISTCGKSLQSGLTRDKVDGEEPLRVIREGGRRRRRRTRRRKRCFLSISFFLSPLPINFCWSHSLPPTPLSHSLSGYIFPRFAFSFTFTTFPNLNTGSKLIITSH